MMGSRCFCFCRDWAFRFFWQRRIGAVADHRHHGEGEHHQRNVPMPPMPGSALVVIEPELVLRGLKTVLYRPPMAFHRHHGEGEHHQRNVPMPPMPGSALVVIEPELVLRGLKTVLYRPPMAFDRHQ